jgi:heat shock protein HtpX
MVVMTLVSVVPMIAYYVYVSLFYVPQGNNRNRGGEAAIIGVGAFIVYFISNLLVLALSRLREYYADRFSGENIRPALLESALAKITYGLSMSRDEARPATRAFMIADPEVAAVEMSALSSHFSDLKLSDRELEDAMEWEERNPLVRLTEVFRTHPLTWKRIRALKEMEREAKG